MNSLTNVEAIVCGQKHCFTFIDTQYEINCPKIRLAGKYYCKDHLDYTKMKPTINNGKSKYTIFHPKIKVGDTTITMKKHYKSIFYLTEYDMEDLVRIAVYIYEKLNHDNNSFLDEYVYPIQRVLDLEDTTNFVFNMKKNPMVYNSLRLDWFASTYDSVKQEYFVRKSGSSQGDMKLTWAATPIPPTTPVVDNKVAAPAKVVPAQSTTAEKAVVTFVQAPTSEKTVIAVAPIEQASAPIEQASATPVRVSNKRRVRPSTAQDKTLPRPADANLSDPYIFGGIGYDNEGNEYDIPIGYYFLMPVADVPETTQNIIKILSGKSTVSLK